MSREWWYGTGYLVGGAAIIAGAYPLRGDSTEASGIVVSRMAIGEATEVDGRWGKVLRQPIEVSILAAQHLATAAAFEALRAVADLVSFVSLQPIEVKLASISNAAPGSDQPPTKTIPILTPAPRMPSALLNVAENSIGFLMNQLGSSADKRSKHTLRAMRWLRRAAGALDPVEEFTVLAFGLEAIAEYLPTPPPEWLSATRRDRTGKPDKAEIIRHFAESLKVPNDAWRVAGGKRHELFHGGLTESHETDFELTGAVPTVRYVLVEAIKHVVGIPYSAGPVATPPPMTVGLVSAIFSQPLKVLKPDSELPQRESMLPDDESAKP